MTCDYQLGALSAYLTSGKKGEGDGLKSKKKKLDKNVSSSAAKLFSKIVERNVENGVPPSVSTSTPRKAVRKLKSRPVSSEISKDSSAPGDSTDTVTSESARSRWRKTVMPLEEKERTVFVGNVPVDTKKRALIKIFSKCGAVESARLRSVLTSTDGKKKIPKKVAIAQGKFSDQKNSCNAYIKFVNKNDAEKALDVNGHVIDGHALRVDKCDRGKVSYDNKTTVFVGNVPIRCAEDELRVHFEKYGTVNLVRIVRDKFTGQGKGFAFVGFKDAAFAQLALQLDGQKFSGRPLRVTRVMKKKKLTDPNKKRQTKQIGHHRDSKGGKKSGKQTEKGGKPGEKKKEPKVLSKKVKKKIGKRKGTNKTKSLLS